MGAAVLDAERILIVDDESSIRAAVVHSLKKFGYEFLQAETAEDAISLLAHERVGCVISDLRMPGIGGHGLVRHCSQMSPRIPVVVISGMADKDDLVLLLRMGVTDYVDKPWSASELSESVRRALEAGKKSTSNPVPAKSNANPDAHAHAHADAIDPQLAIVLQKKLFQVLEDLRLGQVAIPTSAKIAVEVRRVASSKTASMQALTDLIERDVSIAGRVIQLANSVFYRGQGKVMDLSAAVRRIGFGEIVQVIDTVVSHEYYTVHEPTIAALMKGLWQQSWARGVMMRQVAQALPDLRISQDQAYLGGLFVDVGIPFLLRILSSEAEHLPRKLIIDFIQQHHTVAGAAICRQWSLPAEISELSKQHHDQNSTLPMVQLASAAEVLLESAGYAHEFWGNDCDKGITKTIGLSHLAIATLKNRALKYLSAHADDFADM